MDRIISCASRVSWLRTPQGIDLSVITQADWASEKLHPEELSFKDRIQFLCTVQGMTEERRERDTVSVSFTTGLKQRIRQISTGCCLSSALEAWLCPCVTHLCKTSSQLNPLAHSPATSLYSFLLPSWFGLISQVQQQYLMPKYVFSTRTTYCWSI